jgi:hypothetical protein
VILNRIIDLLGCSSCSWISTFLSWSKGSSSKVEAFHYIQGANTDESGREKEDLSLRFL